MEVYVPLKMIKSYNLLINLIPRAITTAAINPANTIIIPIDVRSGLSYCKDSQITNAPITATIPETEVANTLKLNTAFFPLI